MILLQELQGEIKHSKWCKWGVDLLLRAQIWSFILKFFYPVFLADLKKTHDFGLRGLSVAR